MKRGQEQSVVPDLFLYKCAIGDKNVQFFCAHQVLNVHRRIAKLAQMCKFNRMYCCTSFKLI